MHDSSNSISSSNKKSKSLLEIALPLLKSLAISVQNSSNIENPATNGWSSVHCLRARHSDEDNIGSLIRFSRATNAMRPLMHSAIIGSTLGSSSRSRRLRAASSNSFATFFSYLAFVSRLCAASRSASLRHEITNLMTKAVTAAKSRSKKMRSFQFVVTFARLSGFTCSASL